MTASVAGELLFQALAISRELAEAAASGDAQRALALDARRRQLLDAARAADACTAADRATLAEIGLLNDRALGVLEHHLRIKAREIDVAAAGRRAVVAYAATA
jgi:hypothetical protein